MEFLESKMDWLVIALPLQYDALGSEGARPVDEMRSHEGSRGLGTHEITEERCGFHYNNLMKLSYLLQNTLVFEFKALNYHLRKSGATKKMIDSLKHNIELLEQST